LEERQTEKPKLKLVQ